jgi:flavin reductase (DIM6/NTAB) family NADH-FMN oxidoreductase RutF
LDTNTLRAAFARFPSGVTVVAALVEGKPAGMAVSSFTSISLDPPLIAASIQRTSTTWPVLRKATTLGVSVLAHDQGELSRQLSRPGHRFAGVRWSLGSSGGVLIDGASAHFESTVHSELSAGDHVIALLEVSAFSYESISEPLVFHASSFRKLA